MDTFSPPPWQSQLASLNTFITFCKVDNDSHSVYKHIIWRRRRILPHLRQQVRLGHKTCYPIFCFQTVDCNKWHNKPLTLNEGHLVGTHAPVSHYYLDVENSPFSWALGMITCLQTQWHNLKVIYYIIFSSIVIWISSDYFKPPGYEPVWTSSYSNN